jgi:hypothetical protein
MKRVLVLAVLLTGLMGLSGCATGSSGSSSDSSSSSAHRYSSCARLNKKYPNGVGTKGAKDQTHGTRKPTTDFRVNYRVYKANRRLDRDDDGIVCESPRRRSGRGKDW